VDKTETIPELEKSQLARLHSIFIFSGALLAIATADKLTEKQKQYLALAGAGVLVSVGYVYLENQKRINDYEQRRATN
jgi:hypothetical protein